MTAAILAESAALMIALAMPLTPSKTGSTWSMAELFWPEPTYIQEVAVYFVLTNLLIAAFALAVRVRLALRGPDSP